MRRWTSWRRWTLLAMTAHALLAVIAASEQVDRPSPTGMSGASPVCGFCTERGKACRDTVPAQRPGDRENLVRKRSGRVLSTVARRAGGPACSSEEAPVIGVERRGRVVRG